MDIGLIAFFIALGGLLSIAFLQRNRPELPPGPSPEALPKASEETTEKSTPPPAQEVVEHEKPTASTSPTSATGPVTSPTPPSDDTNLREAKKPLVVETPTPAPAPKIDESTRYRSGLARTRKGFIARLDALLRGAPKVDDDLKDEIETVLFTADIGAATAQKLLDIVTAELGRKGLEDPELVWSRLRDKARDILDIPCEALKYDVSPLPYVLLMVGVNGVGKTTTIAKLAAQHKAKGRKVLLVAGDTFRAAATEQLQTWADRIGVEVHAGAAGADPAGVLYEGITRGRKEGYDVVLCDTAGRLHTRKELMAELEKIRRSAAKALSAHRDSELQPHDTFLVLDATIGQNALAQANLFKEATNFTGLVITKLDGTAKGGVVLGICDQLAIPVRFIGIGEKVDDLRPFDPETFVQALFERGEA